MCLIPCHALCSLGPGTMPRGLKGIQKDRHMYSKVEIRWGSQKAVTHNLGGEEVATVTSLHTLNLDIQGELCHPS